MITGNVTYGPVSLAGPVQMLKQSEALLLKAVEEVSAGNILEAAVLTMQARTSAKAGAGVARVVIEIQESILDILA